MQDMDAVYRQHFQMVYQYLMSLVHNPDIAEELAQETFCQAVNSITVSYTHLDVYKRQTLGIISFASSLANRISGVSVTFVPFAYRPNLSRSSKSRRLVESCATICSAAVSYTHLAAP